ncbi:hypothetical protein A5886_001812 [Enterococcus sp. 8G7_MSG3316]|uniref:Uncharacterized protein n=1 Tax=Candidatus Enterococcus testudinis TaxID=1834191 RepID=A0A242A7Z5_9ENTE|nr:nitrogenase subunit molybdenum-iron protein alpha [Enterococcus sp. 8G7_MSG3316]OTN76733.1 hypothetical protein A5886_001812 [Enterococcus sp. 8G7_MSG3316]
MNNFFKYIEKGLSGEIDFFKFSIDLEHYLVDHYEEMCSENKEATLYLNDILPEETEKIEPGMNPSNFYEQVKKIVEKSKTL